MSPIFPPGQGSGIAGVLIVAILLTGCSARRLQPLEYSVLRRGASPVLVPPESGGDPTTIRVSPLPGARARSGCEVSTGGFRLTLRENAAEVTTPEIELDQDGRIPLDLITGYGEFDRALDELERRRCWKPRNADRLALAVVERQPLPLRAADRLLQGGLINRGYFDAGPRLRLRVTGPIRSPETDEIVGFETAVYRFEERRRGGLRLTLASVERTVEGKSRPASRPETVRLVFPESAGHFRLFLMTRLSDSEHDIAILAARTAESMEQATQELLESPRRCADGGGPNRCRAIWRRRPLPSTRRSRCG